MPAKTASEVRENWGQTLDEVRYRGDRVVITKSGKPAAALVSAEDLELLEMLEDRDDIRAAREALAESSERIPYAKVRAKLGLG